MCGVILGEWRGEDPADSDIPGARAAEVGPPIEGWENSAWEKADMLDWDMLLNRDVDPPLGINSLAVGLGVLRL